MLPLDIVCYKTQIMSKATGFDTHDDGPGFVGIRFCQEWFVIYKFICLVVVGYLLAVSCYCFHLQEYFCYSNNMLYPKEDKENKVLLYAVSTVCLTVEDISVS